MPDDQKFNARGVKLDMTPEQRKLIGNAIIDGLVTPGSFTFINPLATEGGDYNQGQGDYNQGGGGNHNQEGGGYNQHAITSRFDQLSNITNLAEVLTNIERLRR